MTTPTPKPRRKPAREINALMQKMVQLKIVQPGQNKEDGSTIYAPTPEFMAFMIAEYIGKTTGYSGLTFKQMEQMAYTILKIGEHLKFTTDNK